MGYSSKQRFLNRRISNGQKIFKEMFDIISHLGNVNLTPVRMTKKKLIAYAGEDVE